MAQGCLATRCAYFLPSSPLHSKLSLTGYRVYALAARKKLTLWVFCILIAGCVGMGLYMVFSPQTKGPFPLVPLLLPDRRPFFVAVEPLDIPLPAFHVCAMDAPLWAEWAYVSCVAICGVYTPLLKGSHRVVYAPERLDLAAFVCILVFIKRLRATLGHAHTLSHLMKTLIQDSTIYFFIMLTFNVAMLVYAVMARASLKNFPLV